MRKQRLNQRPPEFRLDHGHPLAQGLCFAGLGRSAGSLRYIDSSPYGNHGTLTNMAAATDLVWDAALSRFACEFDGADQYINVTNSNSGVLNFGGGMPFTLVAWIYPTTDGSAGRIFNKGTVTTQYILRRQIDASLLLMRTGGTRNLGCSTVSSVWSHIVCTVDADGAAQGWLNGVPGTQAGSRTITVQDASFCVSYTAEDWVGRIADPLVYDRVLSPAEISVLADPSNVMLSGLILPPRRKLFRGVVSGGPAALNSSIAQTLPALTQSVSTDVDVSSSIAQTLPKLTQSVASDSDGSSSIAQTLPDLAQAAAADVDVSASIAQTLPKVSQAAAVDTGAATTTLAGVIHRRAKPQTRPAEFRLNHGHPLAKQLVFAGLGRSPGSLSYRDSSPYGDDGTLTAMDAATDWVWQSEIQRFALDFDGTDDCVLTRGLVASTIPEMFSGSLWIRSASNAATYEIPLEWKVNASNYFAFGTTNGATSPGVTVARGGTSYSSQRGTITLETWTHLAFTFNSVAANFYINGVLTSGGAVGAIYTSDSVLRIGGGSYTATTFYQGRIADVMILHRVLSVAEISALADPSNVMLSGLVLPPRRKLFGIPAAGGPAALNAEIAQSLPKLSQAATADVFAVPPPHVVSAITASDNSFFFLMVDLSSLTLQVGDMLVVVDEQDSTATSGISTDYGTFTQLFSTATAASRLTANYLQITASTPLTYLSLGNGDLVARSAIVYQIRHAVAVESGTSATGTTQYPDPPALNPTGWDVDASMWLAVTGWDGDVSASAYPTSANQRTIRITGASGCGIAASSLVDTAASFDPSTFTLSGAEDWAANTIVLRGGSPVAGAQTLPKLTQSAQADVDHSLTIAQTLPKLTQAAQANLGAVARSAAISQALPKLTQSVAADVDHSLSISQTLPKLGQAAAASHLANAVIAQTLPKLTQAAQVIQSSVVSISQTLPRLSQAITAAVQVAAEINQELPSLTQTASCEVIQLARNAYIDQLLPKLTQRVQIGEPAYAASRSFKVPNRNATFFVQARISTFTVQP